MTRRPTPLNVSFLTVIGWALFLGVLVGRADVIVAAVPLIVALVAARRVVTPPAWHLHREVSAARAFEGERVTVTLTLEARTRLPLVELFDPLPSDVVVDDGHPHAFFALRAGDTARWSFSVRSPAHQRLRLYGPYVRVWDPLGLAAAEVRHDEAQTLAVYPHMTPMRHVPRPLLTQTSVGNYVSPAQGEGIEPGDIRPFVPGDQVRHVNWRATLRLGELHVTQHHRERNADVVIMLDTLSAVGPEGATVLDVAVRGAASIAAAYLARKDRVGLIEYGGVLRWVKPSSGRLQLQRLLDTLLQASVVFTYVSKDLDLVPPRVLPPQALVIAISPLLDRRFLEAATDLAARRFDLVIVAVSPVVPARAAARRRRLAEVAAPLWTLERRVRFDELRRRGLTIVDWDGVDPLDAALAPVRHSRVRRALA